MAATERVIADDAIRVLDHGFVRLDGAMADDLSVVNAARVSFGRRKEQLDEADEGLIRFLMRDRHGTPFEHNSFRFHIRAPIFVAREWFRHRVGCLTGDTVITFVDANGHASQARQKTIDELYRMWTVSERNGHALPQEVAREVDRLAEAGVGIRAIARSLRIGPPAVRSQLAGANRLRSSKSRVRRMRLRVLDENTGEFTTGHIADIIDKGVQPVYGLTLADGKTITLTSNHRVLTEEGWETMGDAVGLSGSGVDAEMTRPCRLMVNGIPLYRDREWMKARREAGLSVAQMGAEAGCSYHTVRKWLKAHDLRFTRTKRHASRPPWNAGRTGYSARRVHTPEHIAAIRRPTRSRGWRVTAHPVEVVAVTYVGLRQTYDLSVAGEWHNFVANGIVVHNSFNEFSMRYAKATDDFYVPEPEDVRSQVGKPGAYSFEPVEDQLAERTRDELREVYETAFAAYERLVAAGVARELARAVLPVGAYTEFFWTVNARALMNFVSLRAAETAQREIRRYADAVEHFFAEKMPVTHGAFVASGRIAP
jgi:thymidylate synthase ThyX